MRIETARGDPIRFTPPAEGWVEVSLPDSAWTTRWPGYDGVAWYRLEWNEPPDAAGGVAPLGLAMDYLNMAGAVYLNGALLAMDASLHEPLSRSWNRPRHWLLSAPLLQVGRNVLLIRVSGLAAFQPGLGAVLLASPAQALAQYDSEQLTRQTLHMISWGVNLAMALIYGLLWMLRRKDSFYGWFSLFPLLWGVSAYNYFAQSPWPFDSTYTYSATRVSLQLIGIGCFLMFTLRFCKLDGSRIATAAWSMVALVLAFVWLGARTMSDLGFQVEAWAELLLFLLSVVLIFRQAWRTREREIQAIALCTSLGLAMGFHDVLVLARVLDSNRYYSPWAATAMLVGISFVLTRRFVVGMRLVEQFNAQLQLRVTEATQRLSSMLQREHAVALTQTRLAERLDLVRDLHDGLGMTLSGHIASLEAARQIRNDEALWALREVRDDLRLIIENSSHDAGDDLSQRLAPLRHRSSRLLEAAGIECTWVLHGLDGCQFDDRRALDFLRLLQEALANVLKHSGATQVQIGITVTTAQLWLTVQDNGHGFNRNTAHAVPGIQIGLGLRSMEARAHRLRGTLELQSDNQGTTVTLRCAVDMPAPATH